MKKPKDVDSYIKNAPEEVQSKLKELRKAIKSQAPKAEERIGYSMPYYKLNNKPLVYFAFAKKHIGLYAIPPITEDFKKELEGYKTSTATIQFPHTEKLPIPLIKKLVHAAVINSNAKYGKEGVK